MGLFYERLRAIELERSSARSAPRPRPRVDGREARAIRLRRWHPRPYQVVTVSSNKGGVGKTTLTANLAVTLRALRPDLPVLVLGLDDQSLLDRMFSTSPVDPPETVATGLRVGSFATAIRRGHYGVHYVPSDPCIGALKDELPGVLTLHEALDRTGFRGVILVDTKSDLEALTRNALAASDLTLVPIGDETSLHEGAKVFQLLDQWSIPRDRARVVLSMLDLRVRCEGHATLEARLRLALEQQALPCLGGFLPISPKVQSLGAGPGGRCLPVLHGAPRSRVHQQLLHMAEQVLGLLHDVEATPTRPAPRRASPRSPAKRYLLRRTPGWRHPEPEDEAAVAHLIDEIQTARAS